MSLTKQQLLHEAIKIGDRLLERAEPYGNGVIWKTVQVDHGNDRALYLDARSSLYSGCSGIALFLSELYKHTGDHRYKKAAVDGMIGCLALPETDHTYALFTGKMSVAIALTRIDHLDPSAGFKDRAVQIALGSAGNLDWNTYDLINGTIGIIVGLLHIHAASGDDRLLPVIELFVERSLQAMQAGKHGVRWDRTAMYIQSITGYSHGAAGFAYAFAELYRYFNNPSYLEIAFQACRYESQFLDENSGNWRDLRGPNFYEFGDVLTTKYEQGDLNFFLRHREMNAWCHGAPGIGLSRLRLNEYVPDNPFAHELSIAVNTTYRQTVEIPYAEDDSACLCHGLAGNAELLIETYRVTQDEMFLEKASDVAEKIFLHRSKFGYYRSGNVGGVEDDSLFMGNAGVGYFLLRLLDPDKTPSILHLTLNKVYGKQVSSEYKYLSITSASIKETLVRCQFPQTLELVLKNFPDESAAYFEKASSPDFISEWQHFVNELPLTGDDSMMHDIFNLENKIFDVNLSIVSDQLLYMKADQKTRDIEGLLADSGGAQLLMADPDVTHVRVGERIHLLIPTMQKVEQRILSEFSLIVLEAFEDPVTIDGAVDNVLLQVEATREEIRDLVITQVKQFIYIGLLIDPGHHKFGTIQKSVRSTKHYVSHE